jgi:tetratricopeptide (TPR) repeat protein
VALDWLRQPETSSMLEISVQAWCVSAMARHQLGDAAGARKALEEVEARVKVLVQTGELGRSYDNRWDSIARGLALRAEAEQLILGKVVSPPLVPSRLIENRNKWQPIAFALNAADQMGKQAQWAPAAEYYKKLLQEPAFDWNVFEIKQDLLCQKIAVVFLMAGDQTNYCNLVRLLLERKWEKLAPMMQERYAQIFVSQPELLTPDQKAQGLAYARRVCDGADVGNNPWLGLLRGTTDYREGRFEAAVETLSQVFFQPSDSDGAARALAYKAMAYKRLGRSKEALEASQEANTLFAKQLSRSGDWTNITFYQLAIKELLAMLANTGEATKMP